MASDPRETLRIATERYKTALRKADDARAAQRRAIIAAVNAGIRQVEIVEITGYTREHIRRITQSAKEN